MSTPLQTERVQRLYLQVAEQLRELIDGGTYQPGDRLPSERDLAGRLGVSRPTIREAIIALEIAGAVEVRVGSGVYITAQPAAAGDLAATGGAGPFEILEARRLIEAETCALAAERIDAAQLRELEALVEAMDGGDVGIEAAERADERFHCLIADAAGNSVLSANVAWLWGLRNESAISTHFHQRVRDEGVRPIVADHQAILDALRQRDPTAARAAMTRHLQRVFDHLMDGP